MEAPKEIFAVIQDGYCLGAADSAPDAVNEVIEDMNQRHRNLGAFKVIRYVLPEQWTLCRDRQPEKEESHLVCVGKHGENFITVDAYVDGSWIRYGESIYAYRPLPEPAEMPK